MSLALMKLLKEQDFPIRLHYFWPLLAQHIKDSNAAGNTHTHPHTHAIHVTYSDDFHMTFSNTLDTY